MIIQGSSKPIVLESTTEINNSTSIHAELFKGQKTIKTWNKEDMVFGTQNELALPLTQEDTLNLSKGEVKLEVKWKGKDYVECAEVISLLVEPRRCKEVI